MTNCVLLKVYGDVQPATELMYARLNLLCTQVGIEDALTFEKNGSESGLAVHYEGIFFPIDEFMAVLVPLLEPGSMGKIDYLDLERWGMTRFCIDGNNVDCKNVPLNNVLSYSGH